MLSSATLFILLNALLLLLASIGNGLPDSAQLAIAAVLIGFVGIPHGAIDHILFMQNTKAKPLFFYTFYFALIGLIISIWVILPIIGLLLFLALSAYHFGQSQFSGCKQLSKHVKSFLYISWGSSILSALVVYNHQEILRICATSADLRELLVVFQSPIQMAVLLVSSACFLLVFFYHRKAFSRKRFVVELILFLLIHLSFYWHSTLIGFSIYFATLHSLEVLKEEYAFLKLRLANFDIHSFLSILTPYTLVSLLGLFILLGLSHFGVLPISKTLVVFITISALTLPHSVVMENFYKSSIAKE